MAGARIPRGGLETESRSCSTFIVLMDATHLRVSTAGTSGIADPQVSAAMPGRSPSSLVVPFEGIGHVHHACTVNVGLTHGAWPSEQGYSTTSCGRPDWLMGATIRDPRATGVRKSPESRRHSRRRGRESGSIGAGERAACGSGVRTRGWRTCAGTSAAGNRSTQSGRRPLARPAILLTRRCSYRSREGGGEGSGKSGIMSRRSRRAGGVRNLPRRVNTPKLRDGKYSLSGIADS